MENPSIYAVFERMWQHFLTKLNSFVLNEVFNDHIENKDNPHDVKKEQIGLENVDNTSDADKPISDATQVALDDKANKEHTHDANHITSGVLSVERGGTGRSSVADTQYWTPRYRASALYDMETHPYINGTIHWVYE